MAAEVAAKQAADAEEYRQSLQSGDSAGHDRRTDELGDRLGDLQVGSRNSSSTGRGSPVTPSEQAFFGNGNARTSMNGSGSGSGNGHAPFRSSRLSSVDHQSGGQLARGGSPASSNGPGGVASPPTGTRGLPSPFSPGMATGSTSSSFGSASAVPVGRLNGNAAGGASVPLPHPQTSSSTPNGASNNTTNGPAFIKIKILDRNTDDMIAIRVPPRVTYDQLVDKVRDRLVAQVSRLQYRNPGVGESYSDVADDQTLREWLDREDKLVLYAE